MEKTACFFNPNQTSLPSFSNAENGLINQQNLSQIQLPKRFSSLHNPCSLNQQQQINLTITSKEDQAFWNKVSQIIQKNQQSIKQKQQQILMQQQQQNKDNKLSQQQNTPMQTRVVSAPLNLPLLSKNNINFQNPQKQETPKKKISPLKSKNINPIKERGCSSSQSSTYIRKQQENLFDLNKKPVNSNYFNTNNYKQKSNNFLRTRNFSLQQAANFEYNGQQMNQDLRSFSAKNSQYSLNGSKEFNAFKNNNRGIQSSENSKKYTKDQSMESVESFHNDRSNSNKNYKDILYPRQRLQCQKQMKNVQPFKLYDQFLEDTFNQSQSSKAGQQKNASSQSPEKSLPQEDIDQKNNKVLSQQHIVQQKIRNQLLDKQQKIIKNQNYLGDLHATFSLETFNNFNCQSAQSKSQKDQIKQNMLKRKCKLILKQQDKILNKIFNEQQINNSSKYEQYKQLINSNKQQPFQLIKNY